MFPCPECAAEVNPSAVGSGLDSSMINRTETAHNNCFDFRRNDVKLFSVNRRGKKVGGMTNARIFILVEYSYVLAPIAIEIAFRNFIDSIANLMHGSIATVTEKNLVPISAATVKASHTDSIFLDFRFVVIVLRRSRSTIYLNCPRGWKILFLTFIEIW